MDGSGSILRRQRAGCVSGTVMAWLVDAPQSNRVDRVLAGQGQLI